MSDLISRREAYNVLTEYYHHGTEVQHITLAEALARVPDAKQPELLTDEEQRIFLAAIEREKKVCKKIDKEWGPDREEGEVNLVYICHEIMRKVKGALWT